MGSVSSATPKVAIIVLNYNGQDCLLPCLASLERLRYGNKEVIVVDNGSEDGSLAAARQRFPEYTYLSNGQNLGFAAGMNSGIRVSLARGAEWVWLFNNDAETETDTLLKLMAVAQREDQAGLLSPLIREKGSDRIWFGKGRVDFLRMRAIHTPPRAEELRQACYQSSFLTGCALLISKKVLETVGLLDERFFLYYEDADFSLRARYAGFRLLVVPGACVHHAEKSRENQGKLYHLVLSGLLFFAKHGSFWQRLYYGVYGTIRRIKNVLDGVRGKESARPVCRAYDDFFHGHRPSSFSCFR